MFTIRGKTFLASILCILAVAGLSACSNEEESHWYYEGEYGIHLTAMRNVLSGVSVSSVVRIAVLDTQVDASIPEVSKLLWSNSGEIEDGIDNDGNGYVDDVSGWNCLENNGCVSLDSATTPGSYHANSVCYLLAESNSSDDFWGFSNTRSIEIVPVVVAKIDDETGQISAEIDDLIRGIEYAESVGAKICTISLNTNAYSKRLKKVMEESDMLFVVSAGNDSRNIDDQKSYPASYSINNMITVANLTELGTLNTSSNYGLECVDIAAPGTGIEVKTNAENLEEAEGTSVAVPFVATVAAELLACDNMMDAIRCKEFICDSSPSNGMLKRTVKHARILDGYVIAKSFREHYGETGK